MLTRQPIFDSGERLVGYEILYQNGRTSPEGPSRSSRAIAGQAAIDALLEAGLEQVTNGHLAFLKAQPEMLLTRVIELIDPRGVVLVLDSDLRDPEILAAVERLHEAGYHFAVTAGEQPDPESPAWRFAEMAMIDVRTISGHQLEQLTGELGRRNLHLLAQGVENAVDRDLCLALGFKMFGGFYFNQPEVIVRQDLNVEHLQTFRLLKEIRNNDVPDSKIVEGFRRNVSLTYKLLRVVNSAAVGGYQIDSIGHAVRMLGRESLYRWLSLLLLSSVAERGVNAEISSAALVRARLCELLADLTGRPWSADTMFVVGLFSRLDLLLGTDMETVVEQTGFTDTVREALLHRTGPDGATLALVEAYEAARWDEVEQRCAELGIDKSQLPKLYFSALPWAERTHGISREEAPAAAPAQPEPAAEPSPAAPPAPVRAAPRGWSARLARVPLLRYLVPAARAS